MRIDDFIIEDGREEHIARHHVTLDEVDNIVYGRHVHQHLERELYSITGRTDAGRFLTVIIAHRSRHVFALVTARDADRVERSHYRRLFER